MHETRKQRIKGIITKGFETYMCLRTENLSENKRAEKKNKKSKSGNSKRQLAREPKGAEGIFGHFFPFYSGKVKYGLPTSTPPGRTNHFVGHH